jgi:hypothetical protein
MIFDGNPAKRHTPDRVGLVFTFEQLPAGLDRAVLTIAGGERPNL